MSILVDIFPVFWTDVILVRKIHGTLVAPLREFLICHRRVGNELEGFPTRIADVVRLFFTKFIVAAQEASGEMEEEPG